MKDTKSIVYLGEKCDQLNQLVYASQLYGTFFTVYAKIETTSGEHTKEREIKTITCHIVNYKGAVNIGLEEVIYNSETGQIDLHLKALGNTSKEKKCKNLNKFKKSESQTLVFRRRLHHLPKESNLGVFDTEAYYRDGSFVKQKPDYDNMTDKDSELKDASFAPGGRCMLSELIVLI
ncbi:MULTISPECIES: hypothetical protein [unclassified Leeuwenhoekiella]|uniref:hypothetical protein n=1 Tax=unclassified Leeuwenhoekiella TaxID=2615029 RepID=UPI000C69F4D5|nr:MULTISPECIES: hypothetical protein [unclassified Leeuwenhoekiella]MAW94196.1 hypothetical protein [Leeuwenhoekiella sp.]MAW96250.1 hypothetical protein [Leeuwenhoekiella sp.]MBA80244.1 hypothetical protein [Leeuwenhoekiella sp.]|tara:strand:- start:30658 stop:31188 length:531 start_codon:yes stop_codon:yes gene_type:complete